MKIRKCHSRNGVKSWDSPGGPHLGDFEERSVKSAGVEHADVWAKSIPSEEPACAKILW